MNRLPVFAGLFTISGADENGKLKNALDDFCFYFKG